MVGIQVADSRAAALSVTLENVVNFTVDTLTPIQRSQRMSRVRSANTKPELHVRQIVRQIGIRYRLHGSTLPGKPDIVFRRLRKVIFVHGCFWHRHSDKCKLTRVPKSRRKFWLEKFSQNCERDRIASKKLRALGWKMLVIWECQLQNPNKLAAKIRAFLEP